MRKDEPLAMTISLKGLILKMKNTLLASQVFAFLNFALRLLPLVINGVISLTIVWLGPPALPVGFLNHAVLGGDRPP